MKTDADKYDQARRILFAHVRRANYPLHSGYRVLLEAMYEYKHAEANANKRGAWQTFKTKEKVVSNCCNAPIIDETDICCRCQEHAEGVII